MLIVMYTRSRIQVSMANNVMSVVVVCGFVAHILRIIQERCTTVLYARYTTTCVYTICKCVKLSYRV